MATTKEFVAKNGLVINTLTGYVKANGSSAATASTTIPGSDISGNISGNAANVTGIVPVVNGGTGSTTAAGALSALGGLPASNINQSYGDYAVPTATYVAITLPGGGTTMTSSYAYRVELTTLSTGTYTGAVYVITPNGTNAWNIFTVSTAGSTSNHPLLRINAAGTGLEVYHNHTSTYSIRAAVRAINTANAQISQTIFGLEGVFSVRDGVPYASGYPVWTSGNLTKVSQLTNDAGYVTSANAGGITGVSGVGLSLSNGVITSNATSSNSANTIVSRDASGNFNAGSVTLSSLLIGSNTYSGYGSSLTLNFLGNTNQYGLTLKPGSSTTDTNAISFLTSSSTAGTASALGTIQHLSGDAGLNFTGTWKYQGNSFWHSGNLTQSVSTLANSVVQRDSSGYVFGNYINMDENGPNGSAGTVTSIITKRGDNYYRSTDAVSVKTFLSIPNLTVQNAAASTDANTLTNPGFYGYRGAIVNGPTGASASGVLQTSSNPAGHNVLFQLYNDVTNGTLYTRSANNITTTPTWSAWRPLLDSLNYTTYADKKIRYTLPDTTNSGNYWMKLGTCTLPQGGHHAAFRVFVCAGYNASNNQDSEVYIHFKTSNSSAVDANGFAGNASYYRTGKNSGAVTAVKFVGNAAGGSATAFDVWLSLTSFSGQSFFDVEIPTGTFTYSGTTSSTDPGVASSTVCVAQEGFYVQNAGAITFNANATVLDSGQANTVRINGVQNTASGFIKFGNAPSVFGYDASNLVYGSRVVAFTDSTVASANALGTYAQDLQTVISNGDYLLTRNQSSSKISLASYSLVGSMAITGGAAPAASPTFTGDITASASANTGTAASPVIKQLSYSTSDQARIILNHSSSQYSAIGINGTGGLWFGTTGSQDGMTSNNKFLAFNTSGGATFSGIVSVNGGPTMLKAVNAGDNNSIVAAGDALYKGFDTFNPVVVGMHSGSAIRMDQNNIQFRTSNSAGDKMVLDTSGKLAVIRNTSAIGNSAYNSGHLELRTTDGSNPIIGFHRAGSSAVALYHDTTASLRLRDNTGGDYAMLHSGNIANYGMVSGPSGNAIIISTTDLNSVYVTGAYRGLSVTNAPDAGWWYINVISHDNSSWICQTATAYGSGNSFPAGTTFRRVCVNGTWGAWTASGGGSSFASQTFTATAGQTTFTISGGYTVGLIIVYVNGYKMTGNDYVASNGTTVVFNTGLTAGSEVEVVVFSSISLGSVTSAQTVSGVVAIANGGTGATSASTALANLGGVSRANFAVQTNTGVAAADYRAVTNPSTDLGYAGGGRFRFAYFNDADGNSGYADVIDLSTYTDSSGGGFNSLYFNKNSQKIQHKWGGSGATSWTVKDIAYADGSNASGTWSISITGNANTATTASALTGFSNTNSTGPVAGADNQLQNGIVYVQNMSSSLLGSTDGALYTHAYSTSWVHQIYGDYRTGQIAVRGKNSNTWQAWRVVLDASNYSNYALPATSRDVANGVVGLTNSNINTWNTSGSVKSYIANVATASRTYTLPDKDGTVAMTIDIPKLRVYNAGSISGTATFDMYSYDEYSLTITGATSMVFINGPTVATTSQIMILRLTNAGAYAITWPAGTKFAGGSLGTLTAAGVDMLGVKYDSSTSTYMVFVLGKDMK